MGRLFRDRDGGIVIDFNKLSDSDFINAILVRDIVKVKMLPPEATRGNNGAPDIMVKHAIGNTEHMIHRNDLVNNYRQIDGKKIKIPFMKYDKVYTFIRICGDEYLAWLIPKNMSGVLNSISIAGGNYVIARRAEDGSLDTSSMCMVSGPLFRRSFKVPMQPIIQKHLGSKSKLSNYDKILSAKAARRRQMKPKPMSKPVIPVQKPIRNVNVEQLMNDDFGIMAQTNNGARPSLSKGAFNRNEGGVGENAGVSINKGTSRPAPTPQHRPTPVPAQVRANQQKPTDQQNTTHYKYRAVGVLINNGNLVGYLIENRMGEKRQLNVNAVQKLCSRHEVSNLVLVQNENGTGYFLRGNGIQIAALPKYNVGTNR